MNWTALSVGAAVVGLVWNAYEARRATRHQVFTEYTRRYQEIMLPIPTAVFSSDFDLDRLDLADREAVLRALRAYFDMCSEELHLERGKKLDQKVWKYWQEGILDLLKFPAFRQAWGYMVRFGVSSGSGLVS